MPSPSSSSAPAYRVLQELQAALKTASETLGKVRGTRPDAPRHCETSLLHWVTTHLKMHRPGLLNTLMT